MPALFKACLSPDQSVSVWHKQVEASGWLRHIKIILDGTIKMVRGVSEDAAAILLHCSDGWDRTAQLACLSQLCLDPYFRTKRGLAVLVEKEWLAAGFKFWHRCGHGTYGKDHPLFREMSPVFLQFLDVVHQLTLQFPDAFEFTPTFLRALYRMAVIGEHGTFLYNCERERRDLPQRTRSAWDELLNPADPRVATLYTNVRYVPPSSTSPLALSMPRIALTAPTGQAAVEATAAAEATVAASPSAGSGETAFPRSHSWEASLDEAAATPRLSPQQEAQSKGVLVPSSSPANIRLWRQMYCPIEDEDIAYGLVLPSRPKETVSGVNRSVDLWARAIAELAV